MEILEQEKKEKKVIQNILVYGFESMQLCNDHITVMFYKCEIEESIEVSN